MSVSTDAILAYGWDLGAEPDSEIIDQDTDLEEYLLENVAHFTEKWYQGIEKEYFTRKREAEQSLGVEIIHHCADTYPMYFLAALGSQIRGYRGNPELITDHDFKVMPNWNKDLKTAADTLGLQIADAPEWYLFSWWG